MVELKKAYNLNELLENCPQNTTICDNLLRAYKIINDKKYKKIVCSISGGSDSDIMLDIVWRCDKDNKVTYVWFNTGLEYQATKDHLKFLEEKYQIEIKSYKAIKAIPLSCREYGQPFISKQASEYIQRLQRHGFQWENDSFVELYEKYPKCKSALQWWCNCKLTDNFNIRRNKLLKEFMIQYPPQFKISNKCCQYAKKDISHKLIKDGGYDLSIVGIRKSEGGARSIAYKNCFDEKVGECDNYRPLFWYDDKDKREYEDVYNVIHSKCYTEYGLKRTGCCGCPYGRDFEYELGVIKKYEPKLYKAVIHIFGDSYEYTRQYREFRDKKNEELLAEKRE